MNIKIMGPSGISPVDFLANKNGQSKKHQDFRQDNKQNKNTKDFRKMLDNELKK